MSIIDEVRIKQFRGGKDEIVKPTEDYVNPLEEGTEGHSLYDLWKQKYQPTKEND